MHADPENRPRIAVPLKGAHGPTFGPAPVIPATAAGHAGARRSLQAVWLHSLENPSVISPSVDLLRAHPAAPASVPRAGSDDSGRLHV